jgi:hypothetical protein
MLTIAGGKQRGQFATDDEWKVRKVAAVCVTEKCLTGRNQSVLVSKRDANRQ